MPQPNDRPRFPALPAAIDLPAMEHEMLRRWQDGKVFERSLEQTATGPLWTFYEGPPTANGTPGVHHIEARVFKDVFPRFKTMQGFHVPRQGGWDCHGCRWRWRSRRNWGCRERRTSRRMGSPPSTSAAASRCCGT